MSTTNDDGNETVERHQVKREYELYILPTGELRDAVQNAEPEEVDGESMESEADARKRRLAEFFATVADLGRDPYEVKESTSEEKVISVGDTEIPLSEYRSGARQLYDDLMHATANYGGQHPLGFDTVEHVERSYRNSPGRLVRDALDALVFDQMADEYTVSDEYPVFRRDSQRKWTTPDDEKARLGVSTYSCLTTREHPEDGEDTLAVKVSVDIEANAEQAVELIDDKLYGDFTRLFSSAFSDGFVFDTGPKTTEVCKRTE